MTIARGSMHSGGLAGCALVAALLSADCAYVETADLDGSIEGHDDDIVSKPDAAAGDSAPGVTAPSFEASVPDAPVDTRSDAGDALLEESGPQACDFAGTWVAKVTADTVWTEESLVGKLAIEAGAGTSEVWAKYQLTESGALIPGSMAVCGLTIPEFTAGLVLGGERYAVDFGILLFDAVPPRVVATDPVFEYEGAGLPGEHVTMSDTAVVLGTTLSNPLSDSWPANTDLVDSDIDGDGNPGVTIPHRNDETFTYLPVDALRSERAERGYYAARVVLSASGTLESCGEVRGQATVSHFDTHIVGCSLVGGGDCSNGQRDTLDSFRPIHEIESATFHAVKMGGDVPCSVARGTL